MSNHLHSYTCLESDHFALRDILRHLLWKQKVYSGIDWSWELKPVFLLDPFSCLPAMCFTELDRLGQSISCHCTAVSMNTMRGTMRGETYCHYLVTMHSPPPACLFTVHVPLCCLCKSGFFSFQSLMLVLLCLVEFLTLCCGFSKWVETWLCVPGPVTVSFDMCL